MQPGGPQATLKDLVVVVIVAFVLLTGLDFLGAGHHSTGATTAPVTSLDHSPRWSARAGANPSRRYAAICASCRVAH